MESEPWWPDQPPIPSLRDLATLSRIPSGLRLAWEHNGSRCLESANAADLAYAVNNLLFSPILVPGIWEADIVAWLNDLDLQGPGASK